MLIENYINYKTKTIKTLLNDLALRAPRLSLPDRLREQAPEPLYKLIRFLPILIIQKP